MQKIILKIKLTIKSFFSFSLEGQKALTFVDVLIGTFLVLIVFFGIFGAFRLGLKAIGQSKNRIVATAIANAEIEKIRNLSYGSIGVVGGFPSGALNATEEITRNNIKYTITRRVDYVVDPADGIVPPDDDCPNDYKKTEIKVSWSGQFEGDATLYTDISPKNLTQECATGGGILSVSVFDAYGVMVATPTIEVKDPVTDQTIKIATPISGKHYFSLAAGTYKVVVSKSGYSTDRTYSTTEIATPIKPNPIIIENNLIELSFSIDKLSSFSVDTLSPWTQEYFSDSFQDGTKIVESSNVVIENGEVKLIQIDGLYAPEGYIISQTIEPAGIISWQEFNYSEEAISGTKIRYQVLYLSGENWILVPDSDLPGNSSGLAPPPIDLERFDVNNYPKIRLFATLYSLGSQETTPILYDWQVSWRTSDATPIPNTVFHLQGNKTIGLDADEEPVYKYSQDKTSNGSGHIDISNLEWDSYTFSIDPVTDLDLTEIQPAPQPISLAPDTTIEVKMYFDSQNSLLVTVQNIETLEPIFSASVRLYKTGYDITQYTNEKGQTYFIPLDKTSYSLEIQASGYSSSSTEFSVSGDDTTIIKLQQIE